jgi:hypothetical protein
MRRRRSSLLAGQTLRDRRSAFPPDGVRRRLAGPRPPATSDPLEDLFGRRPLDLALEDAFDEVAERLTSGFGPADELTVQLVPHIPDLDHLRHLVNVAHVMHMRNTQMDP